MSALERRVLTRPLTLRLAPKAGRRSRREDDEGQEPKEGQGKDDGKEEGKEEGEGEDEEDSEGEEPDGDERTSIGTVEGHAAVFHVEGDEETEYELWSDPTMRAVERVARGAFSRAIKEGDDCRACFNHEASQLLGRTASGTLRLAEDERGLRYDVDLPDTQLGRDVAELVGRGDVTGSSFGFVVEQESWRESEEENGRRVAVRTIESVRLIDVGPVTYPAYAGTSASAGRSAGAPVRALGSVAEARASYELWKVSAVCLPARLAQARARAAQVRAAL